MCSITGVFSPYSNPIDKDLLEELIINAEDRGRDSFGIAYPLEGICDKYISRPSKTDFHIRDTFLAINNNRAEPTTEYVEHKTINDVQPFFTENVFIAHNGTISNDKLIREEYELKGKTNIDSEVIALLLQKIWDGHSTSHLIHILQEVLIGSFALAIVDTRSKSPTLWLATNYKPMSILYDQKEKIYYFTSLEEYFKLSMNEYIHSDLKLLEVKPYTLLRINSTGIDEFSLYPVKTEKKRALVISSSGLDSTVCASWAISQGYDTELLHYNYNCNANNKEEKQIRIIAEKLDVPLNIVPISFYKECIGNSRLFKNNNAIDTSEKGVSSAKLAIEWVPARNLIFLSIAAGFAEAHKFDYIILGGNLEESGNYSDNEYIFQKKFGELLPNALNLNNRVQVLTPVGNLMKHEIVKLGVALGTPFEDTWSCYKEQEYPCGECAPICPA